MSRALIFVAVWGWATFGSYAFTAVADERIAAGEAEYRIEEELDRKTTLELLDTPLQDVVDLIKVQHKIPVLIDIKALAESGIAVDTPITLAIHNVRLRSALGRVLRPLDLTFVIKDDVLLITPTANASDVLKYGSIKLYPIGDLLPATSPYVIGIVDGASKYDSDCNNLIETITGTVDPASWSDVGGYGYIKVNVATKSFVISQTYDVHRQIAILLHALKLEREATVKKQKPVVAVEPDADGMVVQVYRLGSRLVASPASQGGGLGGGPSTETSVVVNSTEAPKAAAPSSGQETGGIGGGMFGSSTNYTLRPQPSSAELARAIETSLAPSTWAGNGGKATLVALSDTLVIRQTPEVHKQIESLLHALLD